ncbi:MAG: 2-octaprenyl-6-methoxyphenyl hydroxylase [Gammaproteobacteria bacterium]|nr:2-octaprenyl-6-methoxyphenyl hydroxylase [Gammaproteobacteria bacterium]
MSLCQADHYDLVIVGAGMVGASLACILDKASLERPLKILLVESAPVQLNAPPAQPSFDARSTVLSYGTVDYLRKQAFWQAIENDAQAITRIHVSDQGRLGSAWLSNEEQGVEALGYVIENRLLGSQFNQVLSAADSIELCHSVKVSALIPTASGMAVKLDSGNDQEEITTELVVLAEGGRSGLCEQLGIHRITESYNQSAIIGNVAFTNSHDNVAYERFTPDGPLALLPLPDIDDEHRAALVWTQKSSESEALLNLPDTEFLSLLQQAFGNRVGEFIRVGQRHSYPLSLVKAEEQVRPGLVLLGNVAHSLHPVAGQGFNLAYRDTMRLAGLLIEAVNSESPLGTIAMLHRYQQSAENDQDKTAAFSHYITRLFSTGNPAAVWARKFGLFSIDLVLPLRRAFARRAMGLSDQQVKLDVG